MRIDAIVFDCRDSAPLARFWAAALGWTVAPYDEVELARLAANGITDPEEDPSVMVEPPVGAELPVLFFTEVPEGKVTKNRLHLDLYTSDPDAEIERLLALGARRYPREPEPGEDFVTLEDPEHNLFDVIDVRGQSGG